ncbi:MAG: SDR family NAD(P)-dependent oxidoreductase [Candidatus Hodarchaeales archaeon]|jgi:short-subunit dehydrogenase
MGMIKRSWFSNHTFLITGGSSGIGLEISKNLLLNDANVIMVSNNPTEFEEVKSMLSYPRHRMDFFKCDITDEEDRSNIQKYLQSRSSDLVGIINCAGITTFGRFFETPIDSLKQLIRVNFEGTILLTRMIFPLLLASSPRLRYLVYISSVSTTLELPFFGVYPGTKAGVDMFFRSLKHELPKSVKILIIRPSAVDTQLYAKGATAPDANVIPRLEKAKKFFIKPEQVAHTLVQAIIKKKAGVIYPNRVTKVQLWIMGLPLLGKWIRLMSYKYLEKGTSTERKSEN